MPEEVGTSAASSDGRDEHGWDWHYAAVQRWLVRDDVRSVRLACVEASSLGGSGAEPVVALPCCLRELPSYRVADFAALVEQVDVVAEACADPAGAQAWHAALPGPLRDRVRPVAPGRGRVRVEVAHPPVDRRGLFGLGRSGPEVFEHEAATSDQERLLAGLARLGLSGADFTPGGAQPPGWQLTASGCTACGVCVKACPTGALTLLGDEVRTLRHDRSVCAGTGDCVELCPESALSVVGHPDWRTVLTMPQVDLAVVATRVCARCRDRYAGEGDLCPACAQWTADPFSVHLPPKAAELLRRHRPDA